MEMTTDLSDHLSNLKAVLTDLDATGQEGFEGLIGTALSEIAGVPFRLARSGSQFGVDGKSAYDGAGISFECKRYAGQVRTPDIMSKIGELSIGETDIDLWVLCATSSLSSQIVGNVSKFSERSEVAHALMVAGFSDHDPFNDDVLDRYRGTDGFIGDAHKAARYAYDRNTWARHWFERMCHARDGLEFWRFSVLFTKIVDGRHDLWQSEYEIRSESMWLFWPSVGNKLRNRIRKWADQRKKKLFGQEVPAENFLRPWRSERSRTTQ